VGVCEAFKVVLAELVDRRIGRRFGGRPVQCVHAGLVVPMHKVEGSVAMSCVNRGIICMDAGLDGGVPIG
jgi:hypothetical protein